MAFRLRAEHLEAFAAAARADFNRRMATFLRREFPEAADIPDTVLLEGIHAQSERARAYGLCSEQQAATFVVSAWLLGESFVEEFPAAHNMLTSPGYSPDQKSDWLQAWTEALFDALEEME